MPRIKICGLNDYQNIKEILSLRPSYVGFIFYKDSPRNFTLTSLPKIPKSIKKTGVFVNSERGFIEEQVDAFKLDVIQLHGSETPDFCYYFRENALQVIKTFCVGSFFDFNILSRYQEACDYFLFDTKSQYAGGSGKKFNWQILSEYPLDKPYFLSGGIAPDSGRDIKKIASRALQKLHAVDLNSRFEIEPGLKDVNLLKQFVQSLL